MSKFANCKLRSRVLAPDARHRKTSLLNRQIVNHDYHRKKLGESCVTHACPFPGRDHPQTRERLVYADNRLIIFALGNTTVNHANQIPLLRKRRVFDGQPTLRHLLNCGCVQPKCTPLDFDLESD